MHDTHEEKREHNRIRRTWKSHRSKKQATMPNRCRYNCHCHCHSDVIARCHCIYTLFLLVMPLFVDHENVSWIVHYHDSSSCAPNYGNSAQDVTPLLLIPNVGQLSTLFKFEISYSKALPKRLSCLLDLRIILVTSGSHVSLNSYLCWLAISTYLTHCRIYH